MNVLIRKLFVRIDQDYLCSVCPSTWAVSLLQGFTHGDAEQRRVEQVITCGLLMIPDFDSQFRRRVLDDWRNSGTVESQYAYSVRSIEARRTVFISKNRR